MVGAMALLGDERQQRQARDWVRRGFLAARRELGAGAGSA
jgi:predicted hotdog family 3-hydroxylacyl-ACP dehydratase